MVELWKRKQHPARRVLIAWFVLGGILVYIPFALQRRFLIGYYIPTAALAGFGLDALRRRFQARWFYGLALGLSLATNVFLLLGGMVGTVSHSEQLFLSGDEYRALQWLKREAPASSLVLASPHIGNYIPAETNLRVIYGHPFETVNAELEEQRVRDFFGGAWSDAEMQNFLAARGVSFIFLGSRERALNESHLPLEDRLVGLEWERVYQQGQASVYALKSAP